MKVAIITPYHVRPLEIIKRCHDSLLNQTFTDFVHILVADGHPNPEIDSWQKTIHVKLPYECRDSGDTPRAVGTALAANLEVDAFMYLDDDNWFEPMHLEMMTNYLKKSKSDIVTCNRTLYLKSTMEKIGVCKESNGRIFCDTNCYLFSNRVFPLMSIWGFRVKDEKLRICNGGDRIVWDAVKNSNYSRSHLNISTVGYVTDYAYHYKMFRRQIPDNAVVLVKHPVTNLQAKISYAEYKEMFEYDYFAS